MALFFKKPARGGPVIPGASYNPAVPLGVCRASRLKFQKIADQAIFYPANSESTPDNRDFCGTSAAKIHRLLVPVIGRLFLGLILLWTPLSPAVSEEVPEDPAAEDLYDDDDLLLMEGEGITVTASPETTQQMKIISSEEIDRIGAPDLGVLLQEALDLGISRYGPYGNQTDINMRGFDSERIAFLIDGVPVNSAMSGDFEISALDLNAVDRIEVIYGGSDTKYNVSGALGGVINIITKKEQKPGFRVGGSVSNTSYLPGKHHETRQNTRSSPWWDLLDTQYAGAFLGYGAERFSIRANVFANRAENHYRYKDPTQKLIRRRIGNEVWDMGASTALVFELPESAKFIAGGDLYYGDKNIPTSGTSQVSVKQRDTSARQSLMLEVPRAGRDDLAVEASLSGALKTLGYGISNRHQELILTAINRWSWYTLSWLTLRIGGDYRYIGLDSTALDQRRRHEGGLYLTAEFQPHKQVLIIPSVKGITDGNTVTAVPKLGLVWYPADFLTLKNNYFRSFKYPDFEAMYWAGDPTAQGNPDLKPEDGWGTDLGAAFRPKKWVTLEGTGFAQWTRDSIHWSSQGGIWRPENVGEAVFFGADAKVRFEIPLPFGPFEKIIPSLSYQYLISYLLSYGYTWTSDKRIPYMPLHTIGASLDIPWKAGSLGPGSLLISGHYEGLRYANTANSTELDPYFLLTVNLNQKLGRYLTAFGIVRNALNKYYESFDNYPMPGLTITVGLRAEFEPGKGAGGI
jgi:vitamin B12 transporter